MKIKKRTIAFGLLVLYLIVCQSCIKMRMSTKKTKTFFTNSKISYSDSIIGFKENAIHFIKTGKNTNPTLFFIHGSPGSWDAYKMYLKDSLLLQKYRMIAIDRPGFGYSNFGKAQNLQSQSNLIYEVIKATKNDKPIALIGHSLGGPIVVKLGVDYPKAFKNIVVLAGSVDPDAENPEVWRKFIMKKPIRYIIPGALRPANDELWWLKDDLKIMKPKLKNLQAKVTIIHGTKDQLVPYSNMNFMQKQFINAAKIDTITLKNVDHFIPWTHFKLIRNKLLELE